MMNAMKNQRIHYSNLTMLNTSLCHLKNLRLLYILHLNSPSKSKNLLTIHVM